MLLSGRFPLSSVIELCRVLRHSLGAGVPLLKIWRHQAERGPRELRALAHRVHERLQAGESLQAALEPETQHFPDLFVTLVAVGEQTGHLPEMFGELERYYREQQQLWGQFIAQISKPLFILCVAVGVIALLIWILGLIDPPRGLPPVTVLGLRGGRDALLFLGGIVGLVAGVIVGWNLIRRGLQGRPGVDRFLLRVPALGPYLQALALGRFAMTLRLTLETGMDIRRAVRLSLEATGNNAFLVMANTVAVTLQVGESLTVALQPTGLFPEEFLHILEVAEESGSVPEVMNRQAQNYHEEAGRRLSLLLRGLAGLVWLIYAGFMVAAIFALADIYLSQLPR